MVSVAKNQLDIVLLSRKTILVVKLLNFLFLQTFNEK